MLNSAHIIANNFGSWQLEKHVTLLRSFLSSYVRNFKS